MRGTKVRAILLAGLSGSVSVRAQEKGNWRPVSTTARGITGPIAFSNETLVINFLKFAVAEIRPLQPAEIAAIFPADVAGNDVPASGHLYRLSIAADQRLLHRNTLCGGDETQWMLTSVQGKMLQVAFFSQPQMPVLTAETMATTTNLCGTFSYSR